MGVGATLLNTSLRGDSLRHALRQCHVTLLLFDADSSAVLAPLAADADAATGLVATADADGNALEPAADTATDGGGPVLAVAEEAAEATAPLRFVCIDAAATPSFASPLELPATAASVDRAVRAGCWSLELGRGSWVQVGPP